jgi:hypothetical protein
VCVSITRDRKSLSMYLMVALSRRGAQDVYSLKENPIQHFFFSCVQRNCIVMFLWRGVSFLPIGVELLSGRYCREKWFRKGVWGIVSMRQGCFIFLCGLRFACTRPDEASGSEFRTAKGSSLIEKTKVDFNHRFGHLKARSVLVDSIR